MTAAPLPPEAIDAATRVFLKGGSVADMLAAAAPSIRDAAVAAERQRIRQLAITHAAWCPENPADPHRSHRHPFADLIGERP